MVIIYQLNIKYGYVSQACMLILHRIENNKSGWCASLGHLVETEGSSWLGCFDASDSRSPPVAGLPVPVPCRPLKRAHVFLADSKRNDRKTKHPELKEVHQPSQTVVQFISWREYIIFQNIMYIHVFQVVQSNCRSKWEDSWSFFVIPKNLHWENPFLFFLTHFPWYRQNFRSSHSRILSDTQ